MEEAAAVND